MNQSLARKEYDRRSGTEYYQVQKTIHVGKDLADAVVGDKVEVVSMLNGKVIATEVSRTTKTLIVVKVTNETGECELKFYKEMGWMVGCIDIFLRLAKE